jgi:hypothetical protein
VVAFRVREQDVRVKITAADQDDSVFQDVVIRSFVAGL